jgi:LAS superfamily LD-carboxypeptidase LdcB
LNDGTTVDSLEDSELILPQKHVYRKPPQKQVYSTDQEGPEKNVYPTEKEGPEKNVYSTDQEGPEKNVYPTEKKGPEKNVYPTEKKGPEKNVYPTSKYTEEQQRILKLPKTSAKAYSGGKCIGTKSVVQLDGKKVELKTALAYVKMRAAAKKAGVKLILNSGFRSNEEQKYFWDLYNQGKGNLAARPGFSNHQNGLALDIDMPDSTYRWMKQNGRKFGFCRTVPSEVWHWELRQSSDSACMRKI